MNLSKIVSKLPSTKKYKLICSPNNFYNLSLKSRYPKNIYAAQNIDLHGKGASTGSIDIEDLVNNKIKYCICLLYTSPSPRDLSTSRMPSSA